MKNEFKYILRASVSLSGYPVNEKKMFKYIEKEIIVVFKFFICLVKINLKIKQSQGLT
jgi:hypothetical protein